MITIIPAIDIIGGKCVRLTKGDFTSVKIYDENPVEAAKVFEAHGIKYLHLVDLDGAKAKRIINVKTLERIAAETNLEIDFGGGIGSDNDLQIAFQSGANKITAGSIAVRDKETAAKWFHDYRGKIILGADAIDGAIAIDAWETKTNLPVVDFIKEFMEFGAASVIVTDISRDGLLSGPAFELYEEIKTKAPEIELIASGGVSRIEDVEKLNDMNIDGVIIGKAIYEGKIKLNELKRFLC